MLGFEACYHHLIAENLQPLTKDVVEDKAQIEALNKESIKHFLHKLYTDLQRENSDEGYLAVLRPIHERKVKLPRSKPIPDFKRLTTKWEQFAKAKGLHKKKREALVFDSVEKNWKLRWGGRSLKKSEKQREWLIEHKSESEIYKDPFKEKNEEQTAKRSKQKLQEIHNKVRKAGYKL